MTMKEKSQDKLIDNMMKVAPGPYADIVLLREAIIKQYQINWGAPSIILRDVFS